MIVRFDFEADVVLIVESDDAGIVFEHAHAPVGRAQIATDLLRGGENGLLQHVLKMPLPMRVAVGNPAGQGFMAAMLAPGLRDGFQFDVGRVAAKLAEMGLDRPHLFDRQIQLASAAELGQRGIVKLAQRHAHEVKFVVAPHFQRREREGPGNDLFDGVVGQHLGAQRGQGGFIDLFEPILAKGSHAGNRQLQIGDGPQGALSHRVHHAGLGKHVDEPRIFRGGSVGIC